MTEEDFGKRFFGSPIKRAKYAGLRRNLAIAMGNSGDPSLSSHLRAWAEPTEADPVLREAARWALLQLGAGSEQ
jgi:epoxyqueuosine reductase